LTSTIRRWVALVAAFAAVALLPVPFSTFIKDLAAQGAITGIVVLSIVVLTGFVGQISFCQYSFAALGAFTVGSLVAGHHWSFWVAMPLGVVFAATVGAIVGIPALRLSGLYLAILTVAVALFFDRYLLAAGTWNAFSGGVVPWQLRQRRPTFLGAHLTGPYVFYLFALGWFCLATLLVWNLRVGKAGRVLRAIRDSEIAAATMGLDLTAWKLTAFAISAGLAGLAGALQAVSIGSVSAPSYDLQHSLQIAAVATVWGVGTVASAGFGGAFLVFGPEILRHTPISSRWFPAVLGAALAAQLVYSPEGIIVRTQDDLRRWRRRHRAGAGPPGAGPPGARPPTQPPVDTRRVLEAV